MLFYHTLTDEIIKAQGREGEFDWHVPEGTVFEMPDDEVPENSAPVTAEWLREFRADKSRLKAALRTELRLMKAGAWVGDLVDVQDIRTAVVILNRVVGIGKGELGEFLKELTKAEKALLRELSEDEQRLSL